MAEMGICEGLPGASASCRNIAEMGRENGLPSCQSFIIFISNGICATYNLVIYSYILVISTFFFSIFVRLFTFSHCFCTFYNGIPRRFEIPLVYHDIPNTYLPNGIP